MPSLTYPQAKLLAYWSFGMVMARSCGTSSVGSLLAGILKKKEGTLRQRLREWYKESSAKKGKNRQEVEVASCFGALLQWVVSKWNSDEKQMALVLDATHLKAKFIVLAISVVYRGCAIPIAWTVTDAQSKGEWKGIWLGMLRRLKGQIPAEWQVLVLADRGLYANWLFAGIPRQGWHPFLRINQQGQYRLVRSGQWQALNQLLTQPGQEWSGEVFCFKGHSVRSRLLVRWEDGYQDPWMILTSLRSVQANVAWYGMRSWIEDGFKHLKRGGWQWQSSRMQDPERASRLWLAMAVATLWVLSVGGEADQNLPPSSLETLPPTHIARRLAKASSRPRLVACFERGLIAILLAVISHSPLPFGNFWPPPWPLLNTYP
jgi:hypothetical protein